MIQHQLLPPRVELVKWYCAQFSTSEAGAADTGLDLFELLKAYVVKQGLGKGLRCPNTSASGSPAVS